MAPALLLAAGNQNFGFDPPGWLDPFFYVGYFWHYPEHLPMFDKYYKISRLPWVLPGFVAHHLAGAIAGTYVLMYSTMAAGAVAMYLLVRDATGHAAVAVVVAVAWGCCTWGHGIGGWNYHMLAAAAYYLAASWLVLRAALGRSPRLASALAGVCLACAIHTHLFMVVLTPLLLLFHVAIVPATTGERLFPRIARDWLLVASGGLGVTVVLGAINAATGGEWLFFMPQVRYTLWLAQPGSNTEWVGDPRRWLPSAWYLVLPLLFLVAGVPVLFGRWSAPERRILVVLVAQAWMAFVVLCFFQFIRRQTVLDHNYQAFSAYIHAFPCLAAVPGHRHTRSGDPSPGARSVCRHGRRTRHAGAVAADAVATMDE
jgi:hypothetical protein